jgi:hypothetical protein
MAKGITTMADRKQFVGDMKIDPELQKALDTSKQKDITEQELQEQRISFAFGNAPANAENITKESVRHTAQNIRLQS